MNSLSLRSCLRTIRRLTNGRCTQAIDVHMMIMIEVCKKRVELIRNELSEIACKIRVVVNKETLVNLYHDYIVQNENVITVYESMLNENDYLKTERNRIKESFFNAVDILSKVEVEMLDKVVYDKKIHKDKCTVCLDERSEYGKVIVSMKCSVFHNLCTSCAIEVFKRDSRCPLCRAYVQL